MTRKDELAPLILPVVYKNITTAYPYHDSHFMRDADDVHEPMRSHPAFGNSFDWHSSVHSHWTAVQLPGDDALRAALQRNLTAEHLRSELLYFQSHPSYERPYGWAWAMALAMHEPVVRGLAEWVARTAVAWLTALPMPVRHGVHSNTAFALGLMLDAARILQYADLEQTIVARATQWFGDDRDWPVAYERSGNDFLSPALCEADLMRRVLDATSFERWWNGFVPQPGAALLAPVDVPDVEDGHIVHLHGLNLSRAAQLARIAATLHDDRFLRAARELYEASYRRAFEGHYTETHWLPTFAWLAATSL